MRYVARTSSPYGPIAAFVAMVTIIATCVAAWITHVVVAIQYLISGVESIGYAVLLAIGVFMPPVGVIHGIGVWFGAW